MVNPPSRSYPSTRWTLLTAAVVVVLCSAIYLTNLPFIQFVNNKWLDAIVAESPASDTRQRIAVVEIDDKTLEKYGQWPWPRYQLARLLDAAVQKGAASVGLDFVMAEPDRTSLKALREAIHREYGYQVETHALPETALDNDRVLSATLSGKPIVLGYKFLFDAPAEAGVNCLLHPLSILRVQKQPTGEKTHRIYRAQDVICNLPQFTSEVTHSGFLNGHPDRDGVLRRLPLLMRYGEEFYPSLALATLLQASAGDTLKLSETNGNVDGLIVDGKVIPIDHQGHLRVNFRCNDKTLYRIPAEKLLSGDAPEDCLQKRIVFIGLSASGFGPTYTTPLGTFMNGVEIQARVAATIASENFIRRDGHTRYYEVLIAMVLSVLLGLVVMRLEGGATAMVAVLGLLGIWGGARLVFTSQQILLSPLLPASTLLMCGACLSLLKYWTRQRMARQNVEDAVILMRGSEKKLDAIIQTIPDIVFRLDTAGRITFISPAITKYAKNPGELIGKHILDIVAPEDRSIAQYKINERRTGTRATSDMEMRLLLSPPDEDGDGEERYFSVSAEGIYTKETPDTYSFQGTQGIARDINRRKQLESQLEQSKKMEAIGSLAAGVAHDLNNILSGLVSYPELLLLDLPKDSPMRKKIETIQHSGQRAAAIVQDMLAIARQSVSHSDIFNLNRVVSEYLSSPEYETMLETHPDVKLKSELSEDLMNMMGSRVHILKVMMNLVNNAAEAMPSGGTIVVATRNRYLDTVFHGYEAIPEGEYVLFSVADEGVGIAEEDMPRIFEPFYTKKRMGRSGSGLGMTVVYSTVKDHDGFLDIRSREGDGTQFDVYLPATRESVLETDRPTVLQDYLGSEKVLVVDDVPEQREIAVRMLSKLGYDVTSLPSGESAIAYMDTNTADILVLDMVMQPGIDGLETYRRICAKHPSQKAIIASGYSESDRVKALQALGAGAYIRKPYTLEKIGLAVRRELDR